MPAQQHRPPTAQAPEQAPAPAAAAEGPGNAAVQELLALAPMVGHSVAAHFQGEGPMQGANATWQATPDIRSGVEQTEAGFRFRILRHHLDLAYWLNENAEWDDLEWFPGGAYDPEFNTPAGAKVHEEAEIHEVADAFERLTAAAASGSGGVHPSQAEAEAAFAAVYAPAKQTYLAQVQAVQTHANPVGPDAEWALYERQSEALYGEEEE